ncbi:hypothetical protein HMN09_01184900 [Mycena chlorophos]|uniref:Uncharacterized protein n=2 Tax=Mycena chlorophos TaxID=658473 RepID=A0A146IEN0_MYCCL|nr:hypothetical protein HMN09_01184900 [Mycena chlorophos]GAT58097.1 predicted protein [Mycena chlorophos]
MTASPAALLVGLNLMGVLINTLLYGFVLGQFLTYFSNVSRTKDPLWIRTIVWALFFLDTIHSGVEFYAVWDVGVNDFGDLARFAIVSWVIPFTATADSVAALMTQFFLLYRVNALLQNKYIVALLGTTSVMSCAFGTTAGIYSGILGNVAKFKPLDKWVILWLTFQSFSDLGISLTLIVALTRSRTGFRKTDSVINRLIIGAIETGVFASTFAMGDLFSFVFFQSSNLYLLFAFPIGRIYTNTLLHVLNSRAAIRSANTTMATTGVISLNEVLGDNNRGAGSNHDRLNPSEATRNLNFKRSMGLGEDISFDSSQERRDRDLDAKSRIMVGVEVVEHHDAV